MPRYVCSYLPDLISSGATFDTILDGMTSQCRPKRARRIDLCGYAHHLALIVEQHTAGVAGIDWSVGLDHVGDRVRYAGRAAVGRNRAADGADEADGHGVFMAEGIADRDGQLADLYLRRIGYFDGLELIC